MVYINRQYYSVQKLKEIYNSSSKVDGLSFETFYRRLQGTGWSIEKSLTKPIKKYKKR